MKIVSLLYSIILIFVSAKNEQYSLESNNNIINIIVKPNVFLGMLRI